MSGCFATSATGAKSRAVIRRVCVYELDLRAGRFAAEQELIAVGIGPRHARGAGHAAGSRLFFHDDLLAEILRQSGGIDPTQRVVDAGRSQRPPRRLSSPGATDRLSARPLSRREANSVRRAEDVGNRSVVATSHEPSGSPTHTDRRSEIRDAQRANVCVLHRLAPTTSPFPHPRSASGRS
jgi:hypothetical protein